MLIWKISRNWTLRRTCWQRQRPKRHLDQKTDVRRGHGPGDADLDAMRPAVIVLGRLIILGRDDLARIGQPDLLRAVGRAKHQPHAFGALSAHKPVRHGGRAEQRQEQQRACYETEKEQGSGAEMVHSGTTQPVGGIAHERRFYLIPVERAVTSQVAARAALRAIFMDVSRVCSGARAGFFTNRSAKFRRSEALEPGVLLRR